ncbi:MAG: hypothetical protein VCE75_29185 [Alphaproteobacteria bacterium]
MSQLDPKPTWRTSNQRPRFLKLRWSSAPQLPANNLELGYCSRSVLCRHPSPLGYILSHRLQVHWTKPLTGERQDYVVFPDQMPHLTFGEGAEIQNEPHRILQRIAGSNCLQVNYDDTCQKILHRVIPVQLRQYMVNTVFNFAKLFQYGKEVFLLIVVMKSQFDS